MSSIPTMKANLVTQLQARPGLAQVQVTNGPPFPSPQREFIWVGEARGLQTWGTFGPNGLRQEMYGTEVTVSVIREGTDTAAGTSRAYTLMGELEAQLRTDPTVNGAVMAARVGDVELKEMVTAGGETRTSEIVVTVECETWN
jgi:hypothetical protein